MNKQEAIKKTEELEKQLAELKAIIEAPETSELVFRPSVNDEYFYINDVSEIRSFDFNGDSVDWSLMELGNCFRTAEDAENSAKYYIMNSDYDYWFPWSGQPKPEVLPKGLECYSSYSYRFKPSGVLKVGDMLISSIYRWKRSEQV